MQEINKELLTYLTWFSNIGFIEKNIWLLSDLPIFFLPIFLIWAWIYYTYKKDEKNNIFTSKDKKENLLFIFYSTVFALIISLIIQQFVDIDRPETHINNAWKLLMDHIPDASFPSDHATVSFAFLVSLFFAWYKNIWLMFLPFVLIMNISRVIAWVHWPFDILAWALVWTIASYITFKYIFGIEIVKKINNYIIKYLKHIKM